MGRGTRLSGVEKAEIWRRWSQGQTFVEIGAALRRSLGSAQRVIVQGGGFGPRPRRRSARHLSFAEREEISRALASGESLRQIARQLGRPPSTISREVGRHGGRLEYRAEAAEAGALEWGGRPKPCKLACQPALRAAVARKLCLKWSPEQIAGWLKRRYPGRATMQVSHETIYRSLFIQTRGLLKKELLSHLRAGHRYRRRQHADTATQQSLGPIPVAVSIRERPAEAEDRAVPGHWEGDLIVGSNNSYIATLVERHSRFVLLVKVEDRNTATVVAALVRTMRRLPQELRRSLTWDRGSEMAHHREFSLATKMQVYFCDPQSPWQRGSNENTNGLLRQYFPKGTDLSVHSQRRLDAVARQMNGRPRETLGFRCPAECFAETLH
jgi:IS30 family transposase